MSVSDLPVPADDLFVGFRAALVDTPDGAVFVRTGGNGPPLLLLHGYPQTHVMWHAVAEHLKRDFTLVIADLPGYGRSDIPVWDESNETYSKRAMAATLVQVMASLGHETFLLAGHDRGGRVAYRMALDHPERVERLSVLDILPTYEYWARLDRAFGLSIHHWLLLAQPAPVPEELICSDTDRYFSPAFVARHADGSPVFDPRAVDDYLTVMRDPERVHASCNDYRAGASIDVDHDAADREAGCKISVPVLTLWGDRGVPAKAADDPLGVWRDWADDVIGGPVAAGHFLCEESAGAVSVSLTEFFASS